jgi:hypothetical protein
MPDHPQRVTIEERARRYVAAMPPAISGQNGHDALFNVVRALIHGFGFTPAEARPYVDDFNQRCEPPWSEGEINHKLRSVDGLNSKWPRGYLRNEGDWKPSPQQRREFGVPTEAEVRKKIDFELEKLQRIAAPWRNKVDLLWLANRSSVDPATVSPAEFLRQLYAPTEKVLCFTNEYSQGEALWPNEEPPTQGKVGVWFLPQPVTGEYLPNPEGKPREDGTTAPSRRIGRCVTAWRYLVIESDKAPTRDWLGFIVQAPLQIEALYTSGTRSVHALVRVDAKTYEDWHAKKQELMPFLVACMMVGGDKNTFSTGVRLSRLPGCLRHGKMVEVKGTDGKPVLAQSGKPLRRWEKYPKPGEQKLLYLRPKAPVRPLCEMSPERDVERAWLDRANRVLDGHEENVDEVRAGLRYYANVSAACAAALKELEGLK